MVKKTLIAVPIVALLALLAILFWARAILAQDSVRDALAAQISNAIGHPVAITSISASVFPRLTVNLEGLSVGEPARVQVQSLHIGTNLGALLRRRIEGATLQVDGARLELPLPELALNTRGSEEPSAAPVRLVSIDEIVLNDVEIISGARTLTGDVALAVEGRSVTVTRVNLSAEGMALEATGRITDLSGPTGELTLEADALDFDQLIAFATDFAAGSGFKGTATAEQPASASTPAEQGMDLSIVMDAARANFGELALNQLTGRARLTNKTLALEPVAFNLFGGGYKGTLTLTLGGTPAFDLDATLSALNVADAVAFAGLTGAMTGTLGGTIDLSGRGLDAAQVIKTSRGTFRVDIVDGTIKSLGLVRAVVAATSKAARAGAAGAAQGNQDEPFSRLGATFTIGGGAARTTDLLFASRDLSMNAEGTIALDGSAVNLKGQVQLSDELSAQAGTDLKRYTQQNGRVTLPATITGSAGNLSVRIDIGSLAERAIRNRATEAIRGIF